jgi:hypothetical protein
MSAGNSGRKSNAIQPAGRERFQPRPQEDDTRARTPELLPLPSHMPLIRTLIFKSGSVSAVFNSDS